MIATTAPGLPLPEARIARWFDELAAHFEEVALSGEHAVELAIAGIAFSIRFAGDAIRDELLPALSHHRRTGLTPAWRILVADSPGSSRMPDFPWSLADVGMRGEVARATGGPFRTTYFGPSNALSTIDLDRRMAMFWVPDAHGLPWFERAAPLRTLLHWVLATHGIRLVHAAAVAPRGSARGALLAGRGGSGKSTTAMLCLGAGFDYAGDDYVAISIPESSDDAVRAHGLFATAKLSATSLERLPFLATGLRLAPDGEEKGVVDLTSVSGERLTDAFGVAALIVPRVIGGVTRLGRATGADALRALAPTTLLQLPGNGDETFRELTRLAARVPAWSLDLGDDLDEIPRHVQRAIEEAG